MALIAALAQTGPASVGLYDYYNGSGYVIPRIFHEHAALSIREGKRRGADGFYAELYPIWGYQTPLAWMVTQLLWKSDQDAAALLNQFYVNYYGPDAGPSMQQFFEQCAEIWDLQEGRPRWMKSYKSENQAALFSTKSLASLKNLLTEATAQATQDKYKRRITLTAEAVTVTEAFVQHFNAKQAVERAPIDSLSDVQPLLQACANFLLKSHRLRELIMQMNRANGLNKRLGDQSFAFIWDPIPGKLSALAELLAHSGNADLMARAKALFAKDQNTLTLFNAMVEAARQIPSKTLNDSFEMLIDTSPESTMFAPDIQHWPVGWTWSNRPAQHLKAQQTRDAAYEGRYGLRIKGAEYTVLSRSLPVNPGDLIQIALWLRGDISLDSRFAFSLSWSDPRGIHIKKRKETRVHPKPMNGWRHILNAGIAPSEAARAHISIIFKNLDITDFIDIDAISIKISDSVIKN